MPEPELNDLLKLLEKKYTKKPEGGPSTPPPAAPAPGQAPPATGQTPAPGQASVPPATGEPPSAVPAARQMPPRPLVAGVPPAKPAAAAVPPPPRPAAPAPKSPVAGADPSATSSSPSVSPSLAAMFPQQPGDRPAPPAGGGMISGIAVPRRGNMPVQGGRRPPPMSSGFAMPTGVPSRFGGPAATPGVAAGAPPAGTFGAGTTSTFGAGRPSAFGGGGDASGTAAVAGAGAESVPAVAAAVQKSNEPAEAHYGLVVKALRKPLNTALRQIEGLNIVRAIRPRLGREVSQWMFRAACFQGLMQAHGRDFNPWSLLAGRKFGQLVQIPDYESIDKAFRSLKIGRVTYTESASLVTFDVAECMVCCGIIGIDEHCCGFVGGLLGSVVQRVTDRDVIVKETKCMVRHADACRFEVSYSRGVATADA